MSEVSVASVPFGDNEKYRLIEGFDGVYAVGRDGSVWSRRIVGTKRLGDWKKMKATVQKLGYRVAELIAPNGVRKTTRIARTVLKEFCGYPDPTMQACHNNGNSVDDRLENLRWDTCSANNCDKKAHGTLATEETHGRTHFSREQAQAVVDAYRDGLRKWVPLGRKFGIGATQAKRIVTGEHWPSLDREGIEVKTRKYRPLTDEAAREIKFSNDSQSKLAERFGVSTGLVSNIKNGLSYTHV